MMKKRVLSMLMVMIMMVSMLSVSVFAVEGEGVHTCTGTGKYVVSGDYHWEACSAGDQCPVTEDADRLNYKEHDFVLSDNPVTTDVVEYACVCGMTSNHTHVWGDLQEHGEYHWRECTAENCPIEIDSEKKDYAKHSWEVQDNPDTPAKESVCACGATLSEHVHAWTTMKSDGDYHWSVCANPNCPVSDVKEMENYGAHNWVKQDTSTATNIAYKCSVCGATKNDHVHVWETTPTWDANKHWFKCVDSTCDGTSGHAVHYDYNGTGICDAYECWAEVAKQTLNTLNITGLTAPSEGAYVDFSVSVAGEGYGNPSVKWNRVTSLKNNTSVALGEGATFAAGEMFNVSIYVPINAKDEISDNLSVTLDGVKVPFYNTTAAFESAIKTYEGNNTVYMSREIWPSSQRYIIVSVMYAELGGSHTHVWGSDWIETSAKHYMMCTGCGETKDTEYHYDNNDSGLCDVCGFDMKYFNKNATASTTGSGTTTHTHTYSTDWVEDISNHWKQCTGCGAKTSLAAHADLNNTGKCDLCGFVMTAAAGHTHTFATEWTETFAQHYKVCSCGAKNEIAAHVDLNNTGKCDTCGYAMTTLSNNGIVADTGDHNATFLWMAAFALSAVGAAATVLFARKKREE